MDPVPMLLAALRADPGDDMAWLALADALEESGQADRAELTRLSAKLRRIRDDDERAGPEDHMRRLVAAGVEPCVVRITNSIGMDLVLVPPGTFSMGSPPGAPNAYQDEQPRHTVEITRPIYLGRFPVTQREYALIMDAYPSHFSNINAGPHVAGLDRSAFPVESLTYSEAVAFCEVLSALPPEVEAKRSYRLPTEAEWEYACRAGSDRTTFHFGDSLSEDQANFGKRLMRTTPVGLFPSNAWGLFDMHGNVWEWCADWFAEDYYEIGAATDPAGPSDGAHYVLRGGAWSSTDVGCRSAHRGMSAPNHRDKDTGFRVACSVE